MFIPSTKEEFIKDIKSSCGFFNKDEHEHPIAGILSFYSTLLFGILEPERIKEHMRGYGIEPIIPNRLKEENIDPYLSRLWEANAQLIFSKSGRLTLNNRNTLLGSDLTRKQWAKEWLLEQESSNDWNSGWFTKLPYNERKYLMLVRSYEDYEKATPDIQRFRISHIPVDVKFEDSLPTIGELYIAHPYRQGVYLPVPKYEHLIFRERIHELSKVMMALGATEIRTLQNSDNKSQSATENSSNTSASAGVGRFGAKGAFSSFLKNLAETEKSDSIVNNFKNAPIDLPRLPEGLIWYPHDKEWQHIAESRLFGNILEYEISLSSKEISLVSEIERSNIEAQAKVLFASGSYSKDSSSYTFFKEESAKTTKIRIKFKSRKDY